jgi:hypothetical protein
VRNFSADSVTMIRIDTLPWRLKASAKFGSFMVATEPESYFEGQFRILDVG